MRLTAETVLTRLQTAYDADDNPMGALENMYAEFASMSGELAAEDVDQYGLVDYSDHPKSITEIKALKVDDGSMWTPRDALIAALRDLDSGVIKPSSIIIVYHDDAQNGIRFYQCGGTGYETVGMLHYAISAVKNA